MYIIENRVFFTSAKFNLDEKIILRNSELFQSISQNIKIEFSPYWFNRFNNDNEYIKFIFDKNDNLFFERYFSSQVSVDSLIDKIIVKTHPNGISSTEVFFQVRENITKFDDYLDEFSLQYTKILFELVFKINKILEEIALLSFSSNYKYGVLLNNENNISNFISKIFKKKYNENNFIKNLEDSYLLRVHLITQNDNEYFSVNEYYKKNDIKSLECYTKIDNYRFKVTLYWAFALWQTDNIDIAIISKLMDIDAYTMNEIVIYNVAGETYTDLMYSIDFESNNSLKSNELFEMYKVNGYYLQKNKLNELSFNEDVNNFVTLQRDIEKFKMQQETYENSEKKFLEIYNAVETNEKSNANRIIQYILTALTLLTIISVSKDIIEFVKAEFLDEQVGLKIDIFSRSEFLSLLLITIIFLFLKLRQHIRKI